MLCTVKSWVKKLGFGLVINYWQRIKIRVAEFFSMLVSVVGFLDLTQMLGENYPRIMTDTDRISEIVAVN